MTGIAELIVSLWFLPVVLFIVIPLVMFAVWHLGLGWACRTSPLRSKLEERRDRVRSAERNVPSAA